MTEPSDSRVVQPRVCLVTGASSGIGAATARALAEQGFSVAIGARRIDRLCEVACELEKLGGRALAQVLDVTDSDSIDAFFSAAEVAFGPVDVVVSNAGVCLPGLLHEVKPGTHLDVVQVMPEGPHEK